MNSGVEFLKHRGQRRGFREAFYYLKPKVRIIYTFDPLVLNQTRMKYLWEFVLNLIRAKPELDIFQIVNLSELDVDVICNMLAPQKCQSKAINQAKVAKFSKYGKPLLKYVIQTWNLYSSGLIY